MDLVISFPRGVCVDASFDGLIVRTDQPVASGGEGSAAAPFDLFLASLGTCAGYYVVAFCRARGIPTDGISLVEHVDFDDATKLPTRVDLELRLPETFPEKYRVAVARAAEHCKVKKVLEAPPVVAVRTVGGAPAETRSGDHV